MGAPHRRAAHGVRQDGLDHQRRGFLLLYLVAALKPLRPRSLRAGIEQAAIEQWLAIVRDTAKADRALAAELAQARNLVRVSRIDEPEAVLLAPEQGFFVRENVKLKLINARLEVLSRQVEPGA